LRSDSWFRPFGALFFGRIGDLVGRRIAFIITLTNHGRRYCIHRSVDLSNPLDGLSPITPHRDSHLAGAAAWGEIRACAAVYVAEHVPDGQARLSTHFIQITATLGLFVSPMGVIVVTAYKA